jgi:hypothetical protein
LYQADSLAHNECNGLSLGFAHALRRLRAPRIAVQHLMREFMVER